MKSVFKLSSSRWALLAAFGFAAAGITPAAAADLGGDCCADLEERVAELEATAARKGNRKVSLTVSGWINEGIEWWDDGTKSNVYAGTNSLEQSRVRFLGEAKITPDWSAGYILELGLQGNALGQWNQYTDVSPSLNPNNQDNQLLVRKSNWFLKSKTFGQVAVGTNGSSTYHLLDDADPTQTRNFVDAEGPAVYMSQMFVRNDGDLIKTGTGTIAPVGGSTDTGTLLGAGAIRWSDVMRGYNNSTPGQAGRRNVVRYDSPTFAGFTVSASWGEDDLWDMSTTYKATWGDFNIMARGGYGSSNDPGSQIGPTAASGAAPTSYVTGGTTCFSSTSILNTNGTGKFRNGECDWAGASGSIYHNPTGLYAFGGWGWQHAQADALTSTGADAHHEQFEQPDSQMWFLQAGIDQKWTPLGKTTIFGQYRHDDAGSNKFTTAQLDFVNAGVIQSVDAAAMNLYIVYQHAQGAGYGTNTFTGGGAYNGGNAKFSLDDFDAVIGGALIQF